MAYFIQILFAGIALGCIYALIGLGFSIIFKASGVINFAQGELLLVGTYVISAAVVEYHLNFWLAFFIGLLVTVLIGVLFERFVLRRMIGRPVFSILMITIGLDVLLRTVITTRFGSAVRGSGSPISAGDGINTSPIGTSDINNVHFGTIDLITIGATIVLCAALYAFFRFTRQGLAMRATALDQEAALALGIDIRVVYALAWGISAALATIGGFLVATHSFAFDPSIGLIALVAFPAIILGGLDSIPGAVVGGLLIGLAQDLVAGYSDRLPSFLGNGIDQITPYLIMIAILLVRPYGLFGSRKVERI